MNVDNFKKHIRRVILDRGKVGSKQRFAVYARDNEKRGAVRAARQMISLQLRNERLPIWQTKPVSALRKSLRYTLIIRFSKSRSVLVGPQSSEILNELGSREANDVFFHGAG